METRRYLGEKGEHVEEVQEQAVGGGPAARREEALHGEGDHRVLLTCFNHFNIYFCNFHKEDS